MFDKVTSLFTSGEDLEFPPQLYEGVPVRFPDLGDGVQNFLNILETSLPKPSSEVKANVLPNEAVSNVVSLDEHRIAQAAQAGQAGAEAAVQILSLEGQREAERLQMLREEIDREAA